MISDDGAFVIPASTPGFLLMEFITGGLAEADRKREEWVNLEKEEAFLISSCINELGLIQLDKVCKISDLCVIKNKWPHIDNVTG